MTLWYNQPLESERGSKANTTSVSYVGNKSVPILRLFRYKEAFSLKFVHRFLDFLEANDRDIVFDPFAGMGTTLFAAMQRGIASIGVERLPIATFVASTLPQFLNLEPGMLLDSLNELTGCVDDSTAAEIADDVPIVGRAFDEPTLYRLRQWKTAIESLESPRRETLLLLFLSILEPTSYTSNDGQFLRLKPDKRPMHPDNALEQKVVQAEQEIGLAKWRWPDWESYKGHMPLVHQGDTRDLDGAIFAHSPTILITSPPYVNRYDYTRSYCLELCFQSVKDFNELKALRHSILRSHIESKIHPGDSSVHPALDEVLACLQGQRLNNPRIPQMLTAYFADMNKAISEWQRILAPGAKVALVVDNVRFHGELVPVDLILSELAEMHGFVTEQVIVARYKGNSSQQMGRYGRVPVRESIVMWRKL